MKILNLFAGIGGNRKFWDNCEVTAVEIDPKIAGIYKKIYPEDKIIIGDAKEYLINNFNDFDFIWASPPCITHSRVKYSTTDKPYYQDMTLWQIILFLQNFCKNKKWCVENVITYYNPLIKPTILLHSHYFWASSIILIGCDIGKMYRNHDGKLGDIAKDNEINMDMLKGLTYSEKRKVLRNCVNPLTGKYILDYFRNLK